MLPYLQSLDDEVDTTYLLLGSLRGSPLLALSVNAYFAQLPLLPVLGELRSLKQLQVTDNHITLYGMSSVSVPKEMSQLCSLTRLELWQQFGYCLTNGCLPSSLRSLKVRLATAALPPAIRAASQLEQLQLSHCGRSQPVDFTGLEALSGLTLLGLRNCNLTDLPWQLLALTKLVCLSLADNNFLVRGRSALAPLTQLTALRELDLSQCSIYGLPQMSTSLQVSAGTWDIELHWQW